MFQGPLLPASAKGSASAAQFTFAKYMSNHRMKMAQTGFVKTIAMLGGEQPALNRTKTMRLDGISGGEVSELEGEPFVKGKHGVGDCWKGKTAYPTPPAVFREERHVEEEEQPEAEEAEPEDAEGEVEGDQDEAEDEVETERKEERNIEDEPADQGHAPECYALSPNARPEKLVVELERVASSQDSRSRASATEPPRSRPPAASLRRGVFASRARVRRKSLLQAEGDRRGGQVLRQGRDHRRRRRRFSRSRRMARL